MKIAIFLTGSTILLMGCNNAQKPLDIPQNYSNSLYSFNYSSRLQYAKKWPDNSVTLSSFRFLTQEEKSLTAEDMYVDITSNLTNCSSLGITKPASRENVIYGKVDFPLDYSATTLEPDCRPFKPYTSAYVLCSINNDKIVAVCLRQVTDNPIVADQIFKSFRWTD